MLSYSLLLNFMPLAVLGLWFDGGRGGDPFRRPNSKLPSGNNGNRRPLPPGMGGMLLAALFLVGFALLLGAYRGVENIRPVDIFLMVVLALLLSRLVRGRMSNRDERSDNWKRDRDQPRESALDSDSEEEDEAEAYWRRRDEEERRGREQDADEEQSLSATKSSPPEDPWDRYRSWPKYSKSMENNGEEPPSFPGAGLHGFDHHEFITGAKILFEKVQEAVASHNLESVQSFLSGQAAKEAELAIRDQPGAQSCSILTLDASIKDILEKGEATIVTVIFNAMLHTGSDDAPRETEAVWRFSRAHAQDNWRLDSLRA